MPFSEELNVSLRAAWKAAARIRDDYQKWVPIPDAPASISTATDHAAQEIILQEIRASYPNDALCAEEATETLRQAPRSGERVWVVDPIDGTRGFAMKNGEFSVMIALLVRGQIQLGVVLEPATEKVVFAERGKGCWRCVGTEEKPVRCQVSLNDDWNHARFTRSRSTTARNSPLTARVRPTEWIETFSSGLKLALVAEGRADAYVNTYPEFNSWDVCAGQILVEEAGGCVTTLTGRPIEYSDQPQQRQGLIASNGRIHQVIVEALRSPDHR
jgi:3'(2'), 5'-bisphosphate nucleotidase